MGYFGNLKSRYRRRVKTCINEEKGTIMEKSFSG
jgi:hypothetical protein